MCAYPERLRDRDHGAGVEPTLLDALVERGHEIGAGLAPHREQLAPNQLRAGEAGQHRVERVAPSVRGEVDAGNEHRPSTGVVEIPRGVEPGLRDRLGPVVALGDQRVLHGDEKVRSVAASTTMPAPSPSLRCWRSSAVRPAAVEAGEAEHQERRGARCVLRRLSTRPESRLSVSKTPPTGDRLPLSNANVDMRSPATTNPKKKARSRNRVHHPKATHANGAPNDTAKERERLRERWREAL